MQPPDSVPSRWQKIGQVLVPLVGLVLLVTWLIYTPAGLLGKADAIGYAVCHRIEVRSFFLADRPMPLCARCSGMYLGVLLGLFYQLRLGRRSAMPPRRLWPLLGLLVVLVGIDGVNSLGSIYGIDLYAPANILRLVTGTGLGLAISSILLPLFNQVVWLQSNDRPFLQSYRQMAILMILAAVLDIAVLSNNPLLLYPLSLLSAAGVWVMVGMLYTTGWLLIFKHENRFFSLRQLWVPLIGGFSTALLQFALFDLIRFSLTQTWAGFVLPQ